MWGTAIQGPEGKSAAVAEEEKLNLMSLKGLLQILAKILHGAIYILYCCIAP